MFWWFSRFHSKMGNRWHMTSFKVTIFWATLMASPSETFTAHGDPFAECCTEWHQPNETVYDSLCMSILYCNNIMIPGSARHAPGRKFRKRDMVYRISWWVGKRWIELKWNARNEWIDMIQPKWMTETNEFRWRTWNEWIEMKDLKWRNLNEWIEMNELKQTNWHEGIEKTKLTWMNWNERLEMKELNRMNWNEGLEMKELKRMKWNKWI